MLYFFLPPFLSPFVDYIFRPVATCFFLSNLSANKFLFYFNFSDWCVSLLSFDSRIFSVFVDRIKPNDSAEYVLKQNLFLGVHAPTIRAYLMIISRSKFCMWTTSRNYRSWWNYMDSLEIHGIKSDNIYINRLLVFFSNEMRHCFFCVSDDRTI